MRLGLGLGLTGRKTASGEVITALPTTGIISEWRFAEGSGTTVADSRGANTIDLTTPTNPNTTWTARGLTLAAGLVQTPSVTSSRTICLLFRVGRNETAGFQLSGGPSGSGSGMLGDFAQATYTWNIGCGRGVSPLSAHTTGQGAPQCNRGGWILAFCEFGSASSTVLGFGGRHSTTTSRCTDFEVAWAAAYSGQLTAQNRTDIYEHVRGTFAKPRGIYIDWRDCPTNADAILLWGESNAEGRALISELSAPDQARTITKTYVESKRFATASPYPPALMVVGTNQTITTPAGQFGPETPLAWAREDAANTRQLWISRGGIGSTYLAAGGLGSSTSAFSWSVAEAETAGVLYDTALKCWYDMEQYMLLQGIGPKLMGMVYSLGLNDATATSQTTSAVAYQAEMQSFYDAAKLYTGHTTLPIVIAKTHASDPASNATALGHVRSAQVAFQAANATACTLIDTDAYGRNGDNVHYNAAGMKLLGAAAYTALGI